MKKTSNVKLYLWIGLACLLVWLIGDLAQHPETFYERALSDIWRIGYVGVLNFILFEYTLPFIRRKRRFFLFNILAAIPVIFFHLMLYSWGLYAWMLVGVGLDIFSPFVILNSTNEGVAEQMGYSMMSVFFFGVTRHIYTYIKLKQSAQQLRIEKQQAELGYLKSQTNPHFLFNTLNNIYSLSRDKSDLAPESILRLSKILRFMLYEAGGAYISIEQELKIISDYIDLERLRYDDSLRINFNYDIEDMKQALPPLLLIPLVENAFKHGVSETRDEPFADITLSIKKRQLGFIVRNSSEQFSGNGKIKESIGLSNLRRQLELLYTDYNLTVQQGDSVFTASLNINLASHV